MPTTHTKVTRALPAPPERWLVQRAGSPGGLGYGLGWVAMATERQIGAHFRTWAEAFAFATSEARYTEFRRMFHA